MPTAIGTNAEARTEVVSREDALRLLGEVRAASYGVDDDRTKAELLQVVDDLQAELENSAPDTGAVVKKVGRLRAVAARIGVPALSAAVGGAVEAFTSMAMSGAFG